MKARLILMCAMVACSMVLFACASQPSVTCVYTSGEEVEITVGEPLRVELKSNPTTGFKWELVRITDEQVLQHVDNEYVPPEDSETVGAAGKEVWNFKALKKGRSTVFMQYRRPWETEVEPEEDFIVKVIVK